MAREVLTVNVGSSSVKFAVYRAVEGGEPEVLFAGKVDNIQGAARLSVRDAAGASLMLRSLSPTGAGIRHAEALESALDWLEMRPGPVAPFAVVAHRVVHDGGRYDAPTRIEPAVLDHLETLSPLAPEHQPHNIEAMRLVAARWPHLPQIACFDTTFHRTMPWVEQTFALPPDCFERGLRRFGFHGLSYEHIVSVLASHVGAAAEGRVVIAHLGHGASLCAVSGGRSIATTMGLTALDGLPMGRRCGRLDPGLVPYLVREEGRSVEEILDLLYHRSGLFGVSGVSGDMRDLLASPEPGAAHAVELFVHSVRKEIGALVACLGGLDVLVFTGGIGENAPEIRARVCEPLGWLGIALDASANAGGMTRLSQAGAPVTVLVLETDEERVLARAGLRAIGCDVSGGA
ncbi:MAG: acetate/propionate family kinase [Rhizobiales bacterium]|nr:acetate/propionate family kinase [Hyphomicrobiales bacterium]